MPNLRAAKPGIMIETLGVVIPPGFDTPCRMSVGFPAFGASHVGSHSHGLGSPEQPAPGASHPLRAGDARRLLTEEDNKL